MNRRPLAVVHPSGTVTDTHHDGHGKRTMSIIPQNGGILVVINHSDGRSFTHFVAWMKPAARDALDGETVTLYDILQMGK